MRPINKEINWAEVLELCTVCRYEDSFAQAQSFEPILTKTQKTWEYRYDHEGLQLFVVWNRYENSVSVFFRGTDQIVDVLTDLNIFQEVFRNSGKIVSTESGIRVHKGFLESWYQLQEQVMNLLTELIKKHGTRKLKFVGHSLGGALAQLAAFELALGYRDSEVHIKVSCVTFGAPVVGNQEFVDFYNVLVPDTIHYINGNDAVAYSILWLLGYRRTGRVQTLLKKWKLIVRLSECVNDHMLGSYDANIPKVA